MFELDLIQTLAFAGVALLLGEGLRRVVPVLARYNLPAPVLGGLLVAVTVLIARGQGVTLVQFDTTLQSPLMIAFFTTIGFGASLSLLKVGGPQVLRFFLLATVFAVAAERRRHPDGARIRPASAVRRPGRLGHADGRARDRPGIRPALRGSGRRRRVLGRDRGRDRRHRHRRPGRRSGRHGPHRARPASRRRAAPRGGAVDIALVETETTVHASTDDDDAWPIVKNLVAILVAMWIGFWVSKGFAALGMTLPSYIGAMLVAAAIRNLDDVTGWFGLSHRFINSFGIVTLTLFLVMALMTLKLWELAGLVLPLVAILVVQVVHRGAGGLGRSTASWAATTSRP